MKYLFIVSLPYSGSTVLLNLLKYNTKANFKIRPHRPDVRFFKDDIYLKAREHGNYLKLRKSNILTAEDFDNLDNKRMNDLEREFHLTYNHVDNKELILVKRPLYIRQLKFWKRFCNDNMKIIYLIRDPRAVCASAYYRKRNHIWEQVIEDSVETFRFHWRLQTEKMKNKDCKIVKYEDLMDNPENVVMGIWEYVDCIPFEEDIETMKGFFDQVENMNYKMYDRVSKDKIEQIENELGDLMKEFGYL